MTYVITEACIGVKDGTCIDVCPVDCIHPTRDEPGFADADQLHIDPEVCIDCNVCASVCPVDAIYRGDEVPESLQAFIAINADYY